MCLSRVIYKVGGEVRLRLSMHITSGQYSTKCVGVIC